MIGTLFLAIIASLLAILGVVELFLHRRHLLAIPIRIHVNGTRGKSSVTRLIAAGLREGGIVTCAKTTGTLARMIMPDGAEYPVFRPAGPNIIEQLRIVRTAAAYDARALVIECMALQPTLQALCELKLIRATHGVITNARADHLDLMGPDEEGVATALAGTTPRAGRLYTAEPRHLAVLKNACLDRNSTLITLTPEQQQAITDDVLAQFTQIEHAENVALALAVCADLGVPREVALRGMWRATPDPGSMSEHELEFFGRKLIFVNGFAANDPESTSRLWHLALSRHPQVEKRIALFNCRSDRPERSRQLGEACAGWAPADHYVLIGTGTYLLARAAAARGLDEGKFVFAEDQSIPEIFETIVELSGGSCLIMGMANIGGQGLDLVRHFKNRSAIEAQT